MVEREKKETPFSIALKHLLKDRGWGSNKKLADMIGHNPGYVSDLSNGWRTGGADLRVEIAKFFDITYEQMVSLGDWIKKGNNPKEWGYPITGQGTVTEPIPVIKATATTHGDRSPNIIGAAGSVQTVTESHFSEGQGPEPKKEQNNEMTAEQGIALKLMLKYWDSKLVQGCLSRLKQIDEELG